MVIETDYNSEDESPENRVRSQHLVRLGNRFVNALGQVDARMDRGETCNEFDYRFIGLKGHTNHFNIHLYPSELVNDAYDSYEVKLSRSFQDQTPFAVHDRLSQIAHKSKLEYTIPSGAKGFTVSKWLKYEQIPGAIEAFQKIWENFENSSK